MVLSFCQKRRTVYSDEQPDPFIGKSKQHGKRGFTLAFPRHAFCLDCRQQDCNRSEDVWEFKLKQPQVTYTEYLRHAEDLFRTGKDVQSACIQDAGEFQSVHWRQVIYPVLWQQIVQWSFP